MSALLRQRRADAARALADDPRRAQLGWDDLAAWPEWAALDAGARDALAARAGAWLHAGALQRCINGPVLQQAQGLLGLETFQRLMATPQVASSELPAAPELASWLQAQGLEALLASVPSPVLRVLLRERHSPHSLPPLPALDGVRARHAVAEALR